MVLDFCRNFIWAIYVSSVKYYIHLHDALFLFLSSIIHKNALLLLFYWVYKSVLRCSYSHIVLFLRFRVSSIYHYTTGPPLSKAVEWEGDKEQDNGVYFIIIIFFYIFSTLFVWGFLNNIKCLIFLWFWFFYLYKFSFLKVFIINKFINYWNININFTFLKLKNLTL